MVQVDPVDVRPHESAPLEPYRWRSDPHGVFQEALRNRASFRGPALALLLIALIVALTYLIPLGVMGWVAGLVILIGGVVLAVRVVNAWAMGGWTTQRWVGATVVPRYVHQASEVVRTDGDGDEWIQWVIVQILEREPRKDEVVLPPRNLRQPRVGVDPRLLMVPEVLRIRGGMASPCRAADLRGKTVLKATTKDGSVTVLCVPPSGSIYRVGDAPFPLGVIDGIRDTFS